MFTNKLERTIIRKSSTVLVFEELREAILTGKFKPGEKINQIEIADALNVSRTPVREAIYKLEERGFVKINPHYGVEVMSLDASSIWEIYLIRARLETLAVREATKNMDSEHLLRIRNVLDQAHKIIDSGPKEAYIELSRQLHSIAYEASGMPMLVKLINNLRDRCEMFRYRHLQLYDRYLEANKEHEHIYEALSSGNSDEAEYWVERNLLNSAKALLEAIKSNETIVSK